MTSLSNDPLASPSLSWTRRQAERLRWRLYSEHWRIGLIDRPLHEVLLAPQDAVRAIRWITPKEHAGYWADPFGLPGNDRIVYCERYDERTGVGSLETLELRGSRLVHVGALEADVPGVGRQRVDRGRHASFPNVFEFRGQRYGLPETSASGSQWLYKVDADGRWHSPIDLALGFAAADPAIFEWQGRLWLAATDVARGAQDHLLLFHSHDPAGPWVPHGCNPVAASLRGSRMAGGFFVHEGSLYRPGQDCSRTYGGAVIIYRVDECSEQRYAETPVATLLPLASGPLPDGLHTLTAWGNRTLVDGKRMVINPVAVWRKLSRRLAPPSQAASKA